MFSENFIQMFAGGKNSWKNQEKAKEERKEERERANSKLMTLDSIFKIVKEYQFIYLAFF